MKGRVPPTIIESSVPEHHPHPLHENHFMPLHFRLRRLAAPLALAGFTASATAQDAGPAVESASFFEAFFWSDDLFGLGIIWLLIACSIISVALTILFVMKYRRSTIMPDQTRQGIEALLEQKKYREAIALANDDPSFLGKITSSALNEAANGYGAMQRALEEFGDAETTRILRPIEVLNVMGNVAPMIGLFGTVYGMIIAFQALVDAGGSPDPVDLAAGISTALVTTFWGLVVAIPALAAYALVRNKIDALTTESMIVAEQIIRPFKPVVRRKPAGNGGAARAEGG